MRTAIVGGGLAGLTLARLLGDRLEVKVYEQAPELAEIGAGVQIGPNGVKVLRAAGLGDVLGTVGVPVVKVMGKNWEDDSTVSSQDFLDAEGKPPYGEFFLHCHRAALQDALAFHPPGPDIALGKRVAQIVETAEEVHIAFDDGTDETADVVIGADGIHSVVRNAVTERPSAPRFSGMAVFRGTIPKERLEGIPLEGLEGVAIKWWGPVPAHHAVVYLLGDGSMNFVGVVPQSTWSQESWHLEGSMHELRSAFQAFPSPVPDLLERMPRTLKWALYDRDVLPSWTTRRIALVGDACHAMVPFMGQGACQAFEDVAVLSRLISGSPSDDVAHAFARYEAIRKPRVEVIHANSRLNQFHSERSTIDKEWVYGYDATAAFA